MTRCLAKPVFFLAGVLALSAFGSKANADFLASASGNEQAARVGDGVSDSWIPYISEYPEISSYLRSGLKLRVGTHPGAGSPAIGFVPEVGSDQGSSQPGIPENKIDLYGVNFFIRPFAADTGNTGGTTSSPSSAGPTTNPQAGLPAAHQPPPAQAVAWLAAENQVLPGTPMSARLFRPPRASA